MKVNACHVKSKDAEAVQIQSNNVIRILALLEWFSMLKKNCVCPAFPDARDAHKMTWHLATVALQVFIQLLILKAKIVVKNASLVAKNVWMQQTAQNAKLNSNCPQTERDALKNAMMIAQHAINQTLRNV